MIEIFASRTLAGTFEWQLLLRGDDSLSRVQGIGFNFDGLTRGRESSMATLAVLLADQEEWWIRPLGDPTEKWAINLDLVRERFGLEEQSWLGGVRLIKPLFDEPEITGKEGGIVRILIPALAAAGAPSRDLIALRSGVNDPSLLDPALNLFRKEVFKTDLDAALDGAAATREPCTVIFVDLDNFKSINDKYGHPVGDEVLSEVSTLLRAVVGSKGVCYRFGGEELTAVLPNYTADEGAALAERIRSELAGSVISSERIPVTASFGVAEFPGHAKSGEELLGLADKALYEAKRLGRNLVRVYGEELAEGFGPNRVAKRREAEPGVLSEGEVEVI